MLDNLEIEIELNNIIEAVNAQINNLADEARRHGKTIHDFRNQNGDPTLGPLLNIKANALHSLICLQHEH